MIDNKTRLNLIIGNPLTHSKSPILHNMVYNMMKCNAVMLAHETQNISQTVSALKTLSVGLTAVTMPFKSEIVPHLDSMSAEVAEMKVANTVIYRNGKLSGYNTDVDGIAYALRNISVTDKNILIIGAGGASHAAAWYLKKNNANLLWLNRTEQKALQSKNIFGGHLVNKNQINQMEIDMIINTTPVGMYPNMHHSPLPDYAFRSRQVVFDMIYNPIETTLLKDAKTQGATCISGIDMFIGQGLKQIELWLEQSIVTEEIMDQVKSELQKNRNTLEEIS